MATAQHTQPPPRPPPPHTIGSSTLDETSQIRSFRDLQKIHDKAYQLIDSGLQADEKENVTRAAQSYTKGLQLLDKALRVNCEQLAHCSTDQIDQAKMMMQKMNKTRQQIAFRLQALQVDQSDSPSYEPLMEPTAPPSYDEAVSEPPSLPPEYSDDDELTALGESLMRREISNSNLANAEELFSIGDGVQIFYITPEGYVSAPTYPTSLHIVRFRNEALTQGPNGEEAPVFLHVGDWVYPLIPGASPALHTNYGAYLFPDMTASEPGAAVGLLIPDTLSQEEKQRFEGIIQSLTVYGEQSPEPSPTDERHRPLEAEALPEKAAEQHEEELDTYGKISKGIITAAEWIAWGVGKGAEKAGELVRRGSEKFQEKYRPAERMHKVDPRVQKGVMYARQATHGAVKVTGYVVNKLGTLTVAIAKQVAPHVRRQGMKIVPKSMKSESSSTIDGIVEVAASGLKGFGTVYLGLEAAAKTLGRCLADETVHIVRHKYGAEASNLAENTMYTAGNVIMTAHNASHLGMKAIAKRAAKETGKAVIQDLHSDRAKKSSPAPAGSNSDASGEKDKSNFDATDKKHPPDNAK